MYFWRLLWYSLRQSRPTVSAGFEGATPTLCFCSSASPHGEGLCQPYYPAGWNCSTAPGPNAVYDSQGNVMNPCTPPLVCTDAGQCGNATTGGGTAPNSASNTSPCSDPGSACGAIVNGQTVPGTCGSTTPGGTQYTCQALVAPGGSCWGAVASHFFNGTILLNLCNSSSICLGGICSPPCSNPGNTCNVTTSGPGTNGWCATPSQSSTQYYCQPAIASGGSCGGGAAHAMYVSGNQIDPCMLPTTCVNGICA